MPDQKCCKRHCSTPCLFLLCQITNLDYDEHKGRISIGRISSGAINRAQQVAYLKPGELFSWVTHRRRRVQEGPGTTLLLQWPSPGRLLAALPAAVFTGSHHMQRTHRSSYP